MGASAAQTVEEIEEIRGRLDGEVQELQHRLPAPAVWTKRLVGMAVGGGVGGSLFWFVSRRVRSHQESKAEQRGAQPVQAMIRLLPEGTAAAWQPWIAAAAGLWLMFQMAEMRQLRRMNAALIGSGRR